MRCYVIGHVRLRAYPCGTCTKVLTDWFDLVMSGALLLLVLLVSGRPREQRHGGIA